MTTAEIKKNLKEVRRDEQGFIPKKNSQQFESFPLLKLLRDEDVERLAGK